VWSEAKMADKDLMGRLAVRLPTGIQVPDERPLAGRLNGAMYLVSAVTVGGLPLLPGIETRSVWLLYTLAGLAALWGLAALRMDWSRVPGWVLHATSIAGVASAGAGMVLTGGATSPVRFVLLFPLVYPSYFYPPAEARGYLVLVVATWASPLLYDAAAIDGGFIAELVIVVPALWIASFLMVAGKREMVALRAHAVDLARRDPLTGLANRRALVETLERHAAGRRSRDQVGLLVLDLDDLKGVNTRYGHPGGDAALRAVGDALRKCAREVDLPARLGGDEFAVVALDASSDGMAVLAERVLDAVRRADPGLPGLRLRASAGWALCPGDANDVSELLVAADRALLAAKSAGKDTAFAATYA
jgi:diguanylate cyclase (GGDEF)-like protein